jgi:hypothetical protein
MTRPQLILKLLQTGHLNVPERRQLGEPSVHVSEIIAVIDDMLAQESRFPTPHETTLEKLADGTYRLHRQIDPTANTWYSNMTDALNAHGPPPIVVSEDYPDHDSAMKAFVQCLMIDPDSWGLRHSAGTIDGIQIKGV